jgi:alkanesulfonate monooxygenase SsuD/methylene tetrahydromethanopterin reductase-like flavin-dependent oxidoreductase (luciferase family)
MTGPLFALALDGLGDDPRSVADLAAEAEAVGFDLVSVDDSFDPPAAGRSPWRFDAVMTLAYAAMRTERIGVLATVTTTHTEPFHVSKNLATLDHVSGGRALWRVAVSTGPEAAARFGRRAAPDPDAAATEAAAVVETVRLLWDSWEDDAVIRDVATGRYLDRDKVHYVDVTTPWFSVRGPSITPRPPQGQLLVAVDAPGPLASLAGSVADLVVVPVGADPPPGTDPGAVVVEVRLDAVDRADPHGAIRRLGTTVLGPLHTQRRGSEATWRERLGLPRPANRYARSDR